KLIEKPSPSLAGSVTTVSSAGAGDSASSPPQPANTSAESIPLRKSRRTFGMTESSSFKRNSERQNPRKVTKPGAWLQAPCGYALAGNWNPFPGSGTSLPGQVVRIAGVLGADAKVIRAPREL